MPLKILANFEPEMEFVLEPGDMLYLPPRWAHDGIAEGECMTYSIGFRSPSKGEVARELLQRMAEQAADEAGETIYRDPKQEALAYSAEVPQAMVNFAADALKAALRDPLALQRALGEYLTEPKANVWFACSDVVPAGGLRLDRRTRMLYDAKHIFINGESFRAGGRDAQLMRKLADQRYLLESDMARLSDDARELVLEWMEAGWLYAEQ
jgi:50S ribosomal protein L16 3-hydroxylase